MPAGFLPRETPIRTLIDIAWTGLASVSLHPARSGVVVAALWAVLVPFIAGSGLAQGVEAEAEAAAAGPELYVRGTQFGRTVPLPLAAAEKLRHIPDVERVTPRIVGEIDLGKERHSCVLVGLPVDRFPSWAECVEGKLPADGSVHQLVVGRPLAKKLGLSIGSRLPPFYRNNHLGERLSEVVGIFEPTAPLWQANLVLTTFDAAAAIFDQPNLATDFLVDCHAAAAAEVGHRIERLSFPGASGGTVHCRVVSAAELRATLPQAARLREGAFNAFFAFAAVVAILVLIASSGVGLHERRREIGILKATGWQTDEVLWRGFVESTGLSLGAAATAFLAAWIWLRGLNGIGLAPLFLTGVDLNPGFDLPYRLTPIPLGLGFVLSLVIVLTGTLGSTWLAAAASPRSALR